MPTAAEPEAHLVHAAYPPAGSDPGISEGGNPMRPKLGVLAHWPIQYHSPLYDRLAERENVELDVLYLSDQGYVCYYRPRIRCFRILGYRLAIRAHSSVRDYRWRCRLAERGRSRR